MTVGPAERFAARLQHGEALLLDGAMGSELNRRGVPTHLPLWSAIGLIDAPDVVQQIHANYIAAGAEVLITDTFRTTARVLARAGRNPSEAEDLDALAVMLAREAAGGADREVFVAGSIAPLEDCYSPWLSPEPAVARAEHARQAQSLAAAGVDLIMIETMPLIAEAVAAVDAALETGLPVTAGFVLGLDGRLLSGETLESAVAALQRYPIAAVLLNCAGAQVIERGCHELANLTDLPFGGYANAGVVDDEVGWQPDTDLTGEAFARSALRWLDTGARIAGGCCGTTPEHIAALRAALDAREAPLA